MWHELYDQQVEDLEALVLAKDWQAVRSFFALWESEEEKIVKAIMWGRFFLTDFFQDVTPDFHFELIQAYFSDKDEYMAAPRGFSKTTIIQSMMAFEVSNHLQTFIVVIEKSFGEAAEVLATVRSIFAENDMIRTVYGDLIKASKDGEIDDKNKDAQGDLFINGVRLRGKGFNAPIRGIKSKQYRPSKIILDDIESDEHIQSAEQRKKYADNFTVGIVPAKDVTGTIKYVGTILHHDSLLMNLIKSHGGKIYKAFDPLDPENTLLWPERWTYARLMQRKKEMEINGQGQNKFYQEYLNTPIDDERRDFRIEDLDTFFNREDLEGRTCNRYICIDAADSKRQGADFTGVVVVDIDYLNNWYVQFVKRYKINSKEMVELIFNLWEYWKPRKIGVEKNAFTDQVKPWLDDLKEERNVFPIVEELMDGGKRKEDRIRGALQGRLESKKIYFRKDAKDDTKDLRGEMVDFPYAKHDDLCLTGDTLVATAFGDKSLKEVKIGDLVLTPSGLRRVIASTCTGIKETIENLGLRGTSTHPVFTFHNQFVRLDTVTYNDGICYLDLNTQILWACLNTLSSMDACSSSWEGKESIIFRSLLKTQSGSALKGCTLQFMNMLMEFELKKAFMFITKMATHLTINLTTWSVYRLLSTIDCLKRLISKRCVRILKELGRLPLHGMDQQKVSSGTESMEKRGGRKEKKKSSSALTAELHTSGLSHGRAIASVQTSVYQPIAELAALITRSVFASIAKKLSSSIDTPGVNHAAESAVSGHIERSVEKVYNITVEGDNVYYANGILVGNCDALAYVQQIGTRPFGAPNEVMTQTEQEFWKYKKSKTKSLRNRF